MFFRSNYTLCLFNRLVYTWLPNWCAHQYKQSMSLVYSKILCYSIFLILLTILAVMVYFWGCKGTYLGHSDSAKLICCSLAFVHRDCLNSSPHSKMVFCIYCWWFPSTYSNVFRPFRYRQLWDRIHQIDCALMQSLNLHIMVCSPTLLINHHHPSISSFLEVALAMFYVVMLLDLLAS